MGLLSTLFGRPFTPLAKAPRRNTPRAKTVFSGQVEPLEDRRMMAADVLLGSVYFEEATGDDSEADVLQVSFVGGAVGTTLDRLVIDGDKRVLVTGFEEGDGLSTGDVFFDTEPGAPGSFDPVGLTVLGSDGFQVTGVEVADGGTAIVFTFDGFEAGEELVFSIDADETSFVGGGVIESNPLVEGAEFQRSVLTGEFSAPGFVDLRLAANYFDAFDDNFAEAETAAGATLDALPDDSFDSSGSVSLVDRTAGAVARAPQVELASLSGYVYHDRDDDGLREAGEEAIPGVTLELLDENGAGTGVFTTTNSDGFYEFTNLVAGTYGVRETQPDGWLDGQDTAGSFGGSVANDLLTDVVLDFGDHGTDYNFGELLAGSIAGRVHASPDGDCEFDDPSNPLEGVTIELLSPDGQVLRTTTTDSQGRYSFTGLRPGEYQVREIQPEGYFDGAERAGTAGGDVSDDLVSGIRLGSGVDAVDYDFCEHVGASLSGYVYHDRSNDGIRDSGEEPIAGATLRLLDGEGNPTGRTAVTDANGFYRFTDLRAGTYQVLEEQPDGFFDGLDTPGTPAGGVADNPGDLIREITLDFGDDAVEYNFGELLAGSIAGRVHASPDGDCDFDDPGELLEGVTIELLDASGEVIRSTQTNAAGEYRFDGLAPGEYQVREVQPEGYFDGAERAGTAGGTVSDDLVSAIRLGSGVDAIDYDFCEHVGASLSGFVYHDRDNDGLRESGEEGIGGVTIKLLNGDGSDTGLTTVTDAAGFYRFTGLNAGKYRVMEIQPEGWLDGLDTPGTPAGGVADNPGDMISEIMLDFGDDAVEYNFGEHLGASLSGFVYHDRDNDGSREPGEEGIGGVTVKLLNGDGSDTGRTTVTDANGFYQFTRLPAGKYRVMEIQPEDYLDGLDTPGTPAGGVADNPGDMISEIMLDVGDDAVEYNFGELLPGSIAGRVTVSPEGDCEDHDNGDPISGVTIELYNADGLLIATTLTDANGEYLFEGLRPGAYTVRELQPDAYFDGSEHVGSVGGVLGDDQIAAIEIGSGVVATDYDFCEHAPSGLGGFVFIDGAPILTANGQPPEDIRSIRDGLRTADDTPLAGVTVRLVNGVNGLPFYVLQEGETEAPEGFTPIEVLPGFYPDGVFETVTDANGEYEFLGLPSGSYAVVELQPDGVFDSLDTPGTTGGVPFNPPRPGEPIPIYPLSISYGTDVLYAISLGVGEFSTENNFSEVTTTFGFVPPSDPPPEEPPFTPPLPITPGSVTPPPPLLIPPRPVDDFIGGSADVYGFTWHLSVINAGAPRELGPNQKAAQFASDSQDPAWDGAERDSAELRRAKWQLLASDIEGAELSELLFGREDAVPVSGDWDGDGVTDVGVFVAGDWYLDLDGDGRWGPDDLWAHLGSRDDLPVTGDWDGDGKTDIGIYGPAWPRDPHAIEREPGIPDAANHPGPIAGKAKNVPPTEEDATSGARLLAKLRASIVGRRSDRIDHVFHYGTPGDAPVAGDWNGDGVRTIGVFRDGYWTLDTTGDGRVDDNDLKVALGRSGDRPIVGDWDGDGRDDLGVYRQGRWLVDPDRDGRLEELEIAATDQALAMGTPVVGDWDGDGRDEPAIFTTGEAAEAEVRVSEADSGTTTR